MAGKSNAHVDDHNLPRRYFLNFLNFKKKKKKSDSLVVNLKSKEKCRGCFYCSQCRNGSHWILNITQGFKNVVLAHFLLFKKKKIDNWHPSADTRHQSSRDSRQVGVIQYGCTFGPSEKLKKKKQIISTDT